MRNWLSGLLLLLLSVVGANAQTTGTSTLPNTQALQLYNGISQPACALTAASTVTSDAATCASNAKNSPQVNTVTLTGTSTLGLPGHLPSGGGESILYEITHSGSSDGPILGTGFQYPGAVQPPECNGSTVTTGCWSIGTQTDWLPCVTINTTTVGCGIVLTNMATPPNFSYTYVSTQCNTTTATSTCSPTGLAVTSGDKLIIPVANCPANNSCTGAGLVTVSSITDTSGFATGCTLGTGTRDGSSQSINSEIWICNVVGTGTATPTITLSGSAFWIFTFLADIHGLASSPDDGVGNACNGTGTTISCALNGSSTQNSEFIMGAVMAGSSATGTPATGYSLLDSSNQQIYSAINTAGANTPSETVSANSGQPWAMSSIALKHP